MQKETDYVGRVELWVGYFFGNDLM